MLDILADLLSSGTFTDNFRKCEFAEMVAQDSIALFIPIPVSLHIDNATPVACWSSGTTTKLRIILLR
jgi:hypothetical protein